LVQANSSNISSILILIDQNQEHKGLNQKALLYMFFPFTFFFIGGEKKAAFTTDYCFFFFFEKTVPMERDVSLPWPMKKTIVCYKQRG
jgi:hypothetical protein